MAENRLTQFIGQFSAFFDEILWLSSDSNRFNAFCRKLYDFSQILHVWLFSDIFSVKILTRVVISNRSKY